MNDNNEIKNIIKKLSTKKKYKDINPDKLFAFFKYSELNLPEEFKKTTFNLKNYFKNSTKPLSKQTVPLYGIIKGLKWAAFPVLMMFFLFIFLLTGTDIIQSSTNYGVISSLNGKIKLIRSGKTTILTSDKKILENDIIITNNFSSADINFADLLRLRIGKNSKLKIDKTSLSRNENKFDAEILNGKALVHINKLNKKDYVRFKTPYSAALVRGTMFGIDLTQKASAVYEVYEGKVRISNRIDKENSNLKDDTINKLNDYFEANSFIVGENNICKLRLNRKIVNGLSNNNFKTKLNSIPLPEVTTNIGKKSNLIDEACDFAEKLANNKNKIKLVPVKISVFPLHTNIIINGKKKYNGESLCFLSKGHHNIELLASGYNRKVVHLDIDSGKAKRYNFILKKKNIISIKKWISNLSAYYLLYDSEKNFLITVSNDGSIEATDFNKIIWKTGVGSNIASKPIIYKNKIFMVTLNEKIVVIDLKNGKMLWDKFIHGTLKERIGIEIVNDFLYLATSKGRLYKFSQDGELIWLNQFENNIETTPVVTDKDVFISTVGGYVYSVNKQVGVEKFIGRFNGDIVSMISSNDIIYMATSSGIIHSYNYRNDEVLWNYDIKSRVKTNIILSEKSLYVFNIKGELYRFNISGRLLWKKFFGNNASISPVQDETSLYFSDNRTLYMVDKEMGQVEWSVVLPQVLTKNIVVSNNRIYLVSEDKGLIILRK